MKRCEMFPTFFWWRLRLGNGSCKLHHVEESWWWFLSHSWISLNEQSNFEVFSCYRRYCLFFFFPGCWGVGLCPRVKLSWIIIVWMVGRELWHAFSLYFWYIKSAALSLSSGGNITANSFDRHSDWRWSRQFLWWHLGPAWKSLACMRCLIKVCTSIWIDMTQATCNAYIFIAT